MKNELKKKIVDIIQKEKKKEYLCHIQFVVKIGLQLAKDYSVDQDVIEAACLLHDIGRGKEVLDEKHNQAGKRLAEKILEGENFTDKQKQMIFFCILMHNSTEVPKNIEEQIVRTADGGSKVEYHEAFMLLCEKPTYEERLDWGKKYLEDGYAKISLEPYKTSVKQKYISISNTYNKIS